MIARFLLAASLLLALAVATEPPAVLSQEPIEELPTATPTPQPDEGTPPTEPAGTPEPTPTPTARAPKLDGKTARAVEGEAIVKFRSRVRASQAESRLADRDLDVVKRLPLIDAYRIALPPGVSVEDLRVALADDIEYIEPNIIYSIDPEPPETVSDAGAAATSPDDPIFGWLWGLHNTGQTAPDGVAGTADADIDAPEAWDIQTGSSSVVVGVIDTGVQYTHPDLAPNMWVNPGETPGNGIDDDGNGYIDDVHGINCITGSGNPMDDHGHGTHVAGTIGAVGDNGAGLTGVNWNVEIMALKFLNSSGSGSVADAIECLNYAVMMKNLYGVNVRVTNNSWTCGGAPCFSQSLSNAITAARAADQLFVAAAGNDNNDNDSNPYYPASYTQDNVIAVAASTKSDGRASFSNYGASSVDLAAPGVSIVSTYPTSGYAYTSGTSMASPHVAGVAALLMAEYPAESALQVRDRILDNVDTKSAWSGLVATGGRLNAYNAITAGIDPGPSFVWYFAEGFTGSGWETYTYLLNDSDSTALVQVDYLLLGGGAVTKNISMPPQTRRGLFANDSDEGPGPNAAFGIRITANQPVTASQALIDTSGNLAHGTVGSRTLSDTWYFAEGFTGNGWLTFISATNPNDSDADVTAVYHLTDGSTVSVQKTIPANGRDTFVGHDDAPGAAFSVEVLSSLPIVSQQVLIDTVGLLAHGTIGATTLSNTWQLAEGFTGDSWLTFVSVGNLGTTDATVTATYNLIGAPPEVRQILVPAGARGTFAAHEIDSGVGPGQAFGVTISSDVPVVVQEVLIDPKPGVALAHGVLGATSLDTTFTFGAGTGEPGWLTFISVTNPGSSAGTATATYYFDSGPTVQRSQAIPANSRITFGTIDGTGPGAAVPFAVRIDATVPVVSQEVVIDVSPRFLAYSVAGTVP